MSDPAQLRLKQIASHIREPQRTDYPVPHYASTAQTTRLKDMVAIITGCNSERGIGRATALTFAANGAKAVVICDLADSNLKTWADEIGKRYPGTSVEWRQFDASDEQAIKQVVDETVSKYGKLDIFFANAGVAGGFRLDGISPEEFMRTLKINVISVFLAIKHASAYMKKQGSGSIIATASVAGIRAGAGGTDYSASKAAVINLVQTSAWQLTGSNVRVNALCPGLIETGMTAPIYDMARKRGTEGKIGQMNPMARGGVADEIARAVLFLASDEASYVNGQAWAVDGGLSSSHPAVPGKIA